TLNDHLVLGIGVPSIALRSSTSLRTSEPYKLSSNLSRNSDGAPCLNDDAIIFGGVESLSHLNRFKASLRLFSFVMSVPSPLALKKLLRSKYAATRPRPALASTSDASFAV